MLSFATCANVPVQGGRGGGGGGLVEVEGRVVWGGGGYGGEEECTCWMRCGLSGVEWLMVVSVGHTSCVWRKAGVGWR